MKVNITKEWCEQMAQLEAQADCDISAISPELHRRVTRMKFPRANPQDQADGWTIDLGFLTKLLVYQKYGHHCSLEQVETVLLALESLKEESNG